MFRRMALLCGCIFVSWSAQGAEYIPDYTASTITFSGQHAGQDFTGEFHEWEAQIVFDPHALNDSHVSVTIEMQSAKTGSKMYDGTLPSKDWFNIAQYPYAVFESRDISQTTAGTYRANGEFTLRGITRPFSFDFALSDISQPFVLVSASFPLSRLDFDIGRESDEAAEWVSSEIQVNVEMRAEPKVQ